MAAVLSEKIGYDSD